MENIEIIPTDDEIQIAVPDIFCEDFIAIVSDTIGNIANSISHKYNISVTELLDCKPVDVYMAIPKPLDITSKEQLQKYTIAQLHEILSIKGLSLSGSKQILVERVWNYIHNIDVSISQTKTKKKKKVSKKSKSNSHSDITSVEDSESEAENIVDNDSREVIINSQVKKEIIYIDKYGKRLKKQSKNTSQYVYLVDNNWVLDSNDNYVGTLVNGRLVKGDVPIDFSVRPL
jgi:hypothetical protein